MTLPALPDFAGVEGDTFRMSDGERTAVLTLVEVKATGGSAFAGSARAPFNLSFLAADPAPWPQGLYAFEHPALGTHHIFVVPVAAGANGVTYQAIFN